METQQIRIWSIFVPYLNSRTKRTLSRPKIKLGHGFWGIPVKNSFFKNEVLLSLGPSMLWFACFSLIVAEPMISNSLIVRRIALALLCFGAILSQTIVYACVCVCVCIRGSDDVFRLKIWQWGERESGLPGGVDLHNDNSVLHVAAGHLLQPLVASFPLSLSYLRIGESEPHPLLQNFFSSVFGASNSVG